MSRIEEAIMKASLIRQQSLENDEAHACGTPVRDNPKRGKLPWTYLGGLLLALVTGGGIYHVVFNATTLSAPKPVTANLSSIAAPIARQVARPPFSGTVKPLPAGIPFNAPDPDFPVSHPGWQRYTTKELDFRIFREGAAVRAIQVIARGNKAIENSFFSKFLSDVAGREKHTLQPGRQRNGFYVQQGIAGKVAELLVYRNKPTGGIRAFVVAYL